jgi:hypothetical protein
MKVSCLAYIRWKPLVRGIVSFNTLEEMTRFLLSLNKAVDTVFAAISDGRRGETFVRTDV